MSGGGDGRSRRSARSSRRAFSPASARARLFASMASALANSILGAKQLARRLGGEPAGSSANFARVDVVVAQRQEKAVLVADVPPAAVTTDTAVPMLAAPRAEGLIEIMLPGGASVRVDAQVDGRALRRVLGVLHER